MKYALIHIFFKQAKHTDTHLNLQNRRTVAVVRYRLINKYKKKYQIISWQYRENFYSDLSCSYIATVIL